MKLASRLIFFLTSWIAVILLNSESTEALPSCGTMIQRLKPLSIPSLIKAAKNLPDGEAFAIDLNGWLSLSSGQERYLVFSNHRILLVEPSNDSQKRKSGYYQFEELDQDRSGNLRHIDGRKFHFGILQSLLRSPLGRIPIRKVRPTPFEWSILINALPGRSGSAAFEEGLSSTLGLTSQNTIQNRRLGTITGTLSRALLIAALISPWPFSMSSPYSGKRTSPFGYVIDRLVAEVSNPQELEMSLNQSGGELKEILNELRRLNGLEVIEPNSSPAPSKASLLTYLGAARRLESQLKDRDFQLEVIRHARTTKRITVDGVLYLEWDKDYPQFIFTSSGIQPQVTRLPAALILKIIDSEIFRNSASAELLRTLESQIEATKVSPSPDSQLRHQMIEEVFKGLAPQKPFSKSLGRMLAPENHARAEGAWLDAVFENLLSKGDDLSDEDLKTLVKRLASLRSRSPSSADEFRIQNGILQRARQILHAQPIQDRILRINLTPEELKSFEEF